jgi:hypothetical protein
MASRSECVKHFGEIFVIFPRAAKAIPNNCAAFREVKLRYLAVFNYIVARSDHMVLSKL